MEYDAAAADAGPLVMTGRTGSSVLTVPVMVTLVLRCWGSPGGPAAAAGVDAATAVDNMNS